MTNNPQAEREKEISVICRDISEALDDITHGRTTRIAKRSDVRPSLEKLKNTSMKPFDYVTTYSGRKVSPTRGVPSLEDLALSLSRQPRFGGMCRRHWTVVDHSLFAARLAEKDGVAPAGVLAVLLHDAHEWTGDIPTHFKVREQRALQKRMDEAIHAEHGGSSEGWWGTIKEYDRRALLAEAVVVGPPSFKQTSDVLEHFGERPRLRDVVALLKGLENESLGVHPSEQAYLALGWNAQVFIRKVRTLQKEIESQQATTAPRHNEPKGFVANESRGKE